MARKDAVRKKEDFRIMVLLVQESMRTRDVASIFSVSPKEVTKVLYVGGFRIKELKRKPYISWEEREKIIQKWCEDESKSEKLHSVLHSYNIRFEDFLEHPFSHCYECSKEAVGKVKFTPQQVEEVAELRRQGMTCKAIGLRCGHSPYRVRRMILLHNETSDRPIDFKKERMRRILELIRAGLTIEQVAVALGVTRSTIMNYITRYRRSGKRLPKISKKAHKKDDHKLANLEGISIAIKEGPIWERRKTIAELYRQGMTLEAIGRQYGITRERIRQIIHRFNQLAGNPVSIRPRVSPKVLERREQVVELCRAGKTTRQIAEILGIRQELARWDIIVYNRTAQCPIKFQNVDPRRIADDIREKIIQERQKGATQLSLAKQFGVVQGTIFKILKAAGLTRPRRSAPKKVSPKNRPKT